MQRRLIISLSEQLCLRVTVCIFIFVINYLSFANDRSFINDPRESRGEAANMSRSRVRDCDSAIALTESVDAGVRARAHPRPRRVARQCQRRMLTEEGIASRWKVFACLSRSPTYSLFFNARITFPRCAEIESRQLFVRRSKVNGKTRDARDDLRGRDARKSHGSSSRASSARNRR